ncbi:uncharacterized protein LOC128158335 [Crassostrea angulata]|uniref:Kelch-like protein 28 n=1 Tax=Magallana gigas TaxID=29159 RepID=K1RNQ1_MAGGI|nr:uncharacterized protein LOC128158335 [Crassostrea angulata]|eukprot:XP_011417982.1 PREDICTED: uncharacterized protein LOC105321418 [Crassostrea gigas]
MAFSVSSGNNSPVDSPLSTSLDLENEYFDYDPEVTDFTLIVEDQKLHVAKVVLIDASPVFRKMLTGEFKEKNMTELELPGKKYSSFELFLRCTFPREYTLTETCIDDILPLADEYNVKCVLKKCENWLLTELEFKNAKVRPHYQDVEGDVRYLMKCLYYGEKYSLEELYKKSFTTVLPFKFQRYIENEHYQMLPEKNKRELLEMRLKGIEEDVAGRTGGGIFGSTYQKNKGNSYGQPSFGYATPSVQVELYQCSSTLFL